MNRFRVNYYDQISVEAIQEINSSHDVCNLQRHMVWDLGAICNSRRNLPARILKSRFCTKWDFSLKPPKKRTWS